MDDTKKLVSGMLKKPKTARYHSARVSGMSSSRRHETTRDSATDARIATLLTAPRGERPARLTEAFLAEVAAPPKGKCDLYADREIPGLAARVTSNGVVSFVLNYRMHGQRRRYTLGRWPEFSVKDARDRAFEMRREIQRDGLDPFAKRAQARREAEAKNLAQTTIKDLADRYLAEYSPHHHGPSMLRDVKSVLATILLPYFGGRPVTSITHSDILKLHTALRGTPFRANRVLSLCGSMFRQAIDWGMRSDNPTTKVKKYPEPQRTRWLDKDEVARLNAALDEEPNQVAADAVRLVLLTGSRRSEIEKARRSQFDLKNGIFAKPAGSTKQKKLHYVHLSPQAIAIVKKRLAQTEGSEFLYPVEHGNSKRTAPGPMGIKHTWESAVKAAGLNTAGSEKITVHSLRHTHASLLVSNGVDLFVVSKILGHSNLQTTMRYAHLAEKPQRDASHKFGNIFERATKRG